MAFFGPNQYKSLVFFLRTIRISDVQTLIHSSGLGPLVQTPTTCVEVQEGLVAALRRPWWCRGAKEASGVVRLLCSDTLRVRLCRFGPVSPRWTLWNPLGGEGGRLQGLTHGPRSHPAPGGRGKIVFLCHALCVTLSRKWPTRQCPECGV
jgi:hypothetical protein